MENIFVPSKNRIENSPLLKSAEENYIVITVVVEPQDYHRYKERFPGFNYLRLPKDNGGITFVRNYIKEHTENNGILNYWQLDDDISGLFYREGTRLIRSGFEVLEKSKEQLIKAGVALGGLEYRQFAWSATKAIIENSFCDSCVFVDNTKLFGMRYREYIEGKEDRDFAMQVIKNGHKTGRTTLFSFSAPPNGSNAGGLKEIFYDIGREEVCVSRMVEIWGDRICIPIVKDNGRNDIKIMWNEINSKQTSMF